MKEEALTKFVDTMTGILQSAKDFTLEQAPDVMRQVVALGIWRNAVYLVLGIAAVLVGYRMARMATKEAKKEILKQNDGIMFGCGFGALFLIGGGSATVVCSVDDLITASVAPKVYLIEYFAHLSRGSK